MTKRDYNAETDFVKRRRINFLLTRTAIRHSGYQARTLTGRAGIAAQAGLK
jgi:hypothetical protein